jgi:hypothetical protein
MVQVGWNTGPRHAHVFGLVKSYTKTLDSQTAIDHDQDTITAMTLMWGIAKTFLQTETIAAVTDAVDETGLPKLATRNVAKGG